MELLSTEGAINNYKNFEVRVSNFVKFSTTLISGKYNLLTVLGPAGSIKEWSKAKGDSYRLVYLFQCDCGNKVVHPLGRVANNVIKSCGCLKKESSAETGRLNSKLCRDNKHLFKTKKEFRESNLNQLNNIKDELHETEFPNNEIYQSYLKYKSAAKKVNRNFTLTHLEFKDIVIKPCGYCGKRIDNKLSGIDRINNEIGYELNNSRPCCFICNQAKHALPENTFLQKIKEIYENLNLNLIP